MEAKDQYSLTEDKDQPTEPEIFTVGHAEFPDSITSELKNAL
jgi:hypothetical protein